MRGSNKWSFRPYTRLHQTNRANVPYICSLAPFADGFSFEWFDRGSNGEHKLVVHKLHTYDDPIEYKVADSVVRIEGLEKGVTYEIALWREDMSASSVTRLVRTGATFGTVVNYNHPKDSKMYDISGQFLGAPSILKLPSGKLLCCMEVHGDFSELVSLIFESLDGGLSWHYVTDLAPCHMPKLFWHKDKLYCIAAGPGDIVIGCSEDEGRNWSTPERIVVGLRNDDYRCHKGACPIVVHNGRLYTTFEYGSWKGWNYGYSLISIDLNDDLMVAENWIYTDLAFVDRSKEGMPKAPAVTTVECNAVVLPDDTVGIITRLDPKEPIEYYSNKAMISRQNPNDPEGALEFDRIVDMPCGIRNKFCVRKVPNSSYYIATCNENTEDYTWGRGILTLAVSEDLVNWRVAKRIVDVRRDTRYGDMKMVAYSDSDFDFDGDDLIVVTRTADNEPSNHHDNNYVNFFRVENYRQYLL
ncbi:MAG: exo-alpha-sialidase [Ruminococcaceae bacterium]|nr:exo-alpha-sialidase [Oscillospiraceae bacterium]